MRAKYLQLHFLSVGLACLRLPGALQLAIDVWSLLRAAVGLQCGLQDLELCPLPGALSHGGYHRGLNGQSAPEAPQEGRLQSSWWAGSAPHRDRSSPAKSIQRPHCGNDALGKPHVFHMWCCVHGVCMPEHFTRSLTQRYIAGSSFVQGRLSQTSPTQMEQAPVVLHWGKGMTRSRRSKV